jgi:hypothetical protein
MGKSQTSEFFADLKNETSGFNWIAIDRLSSNASRLAHIKPSTIGFCSVLNLLQLV